MATTQTLRIGKQIPDFTLPTLEEFRAATEREFIRRKSTTLSTRVPPPDVAGR